MLNLFNRTRRLNVHPSLLPQYRGPAPIQHAIADGQSETGVSILNIDPFSRGVDSGDVWGSRVIVRSKHIRHLTAKDWIHASTESTAARYFPFTPWDFGWGRGRSTSINIACHNHGNSEYWVLWCHWSHALPKATAVSQNSTQCTFAPFIKREFTQIDWETWDAHRLDRVHRAVSHQVSCFHTLVRSL